MMPYNTSRAAQHSTAFWYDTVTVKTGADSLPDGTVHDTILHNSMVNVAIPTQKSHREQNENKENKDSLTILVSFLLWVRDRLNLLRIES